MLKFYSILFPIAVHTHHFHSPPFFLDSVMIVSRQSSPRAAAMIQNRSSWYTSTVLQIARTQCTKNSNRVRIALITENSTIAMMQLPGCNRWLLGDVKFGPLGQTGYVTPW